MGKSGNKVPVYGGDRPYIFISYSHKDTDRVIPIIVAMEALGYRVWFDQGIEAGSEWSNNIANHLRDCGAFVSFVSANSMASENCLDEIAFAKSHNKPSLMVSLEENVELPAGVEMQTARFQRMMCLPDESAERFASRLEEAKLLSSCRGDDAYENYVYADFKSSTSPLTYVEKNPKKLKVAAVICAAIVAALIICAAVILLAPKETENPHQTPAESSAETNDTQGEETPFESENETRPEETPEETGDSSETESAVETPAETPEETEPPEEPELVMSDDLADFTFMLAGKVYKLPMDYSDFAADGWMLEERTVTIDGKLQLYEDVLIGGHSETSLGFIKNGNKINCSIYNPSGDSKPIKECVICMVSVSKQYGTDFEIAKEIKTNSSIEEIRKAFGIPTSSTANGIKYEFSHMCYVSFYSVVQDNMTIELNARALVKDEPTETDLTRPEYLDTYEAPEELGDDILSGNVKLFDGMIIRMPVPLEVFLENGWEITTALQSYVVSEGELDVTIQKEGKKIKVMLKNYAEYQTSLENCMVIRLTVETNEYDPEEIVELPGGIRMGMSYDELRSRLPLNKFTEQDLTSIYSHYSWYSGHTYTRMQGMVLRVSHEQYNLPNRVFYYVEVRSVWTGDYS